MFSHFHEHRLPLRTEAEARLCRQNPSGAPKSTSEKVGEWAGDWFTYIAGKGIDLGKGMFVEAPVGFWNSLKKAWGVEMPKITKDDARKFLESSKAFFAAAPGCLKNILESLVDPNVETLRQMQTENLWLSAFRDPNILTAAPEPLAGRPVYGPREYLLSLESKRRAELFYDYVSGRFIGTDVQDNYEDVFGNASLTSKERAEHVRSNPQRVETVQHALGNMIGAFEDPRNPLGAAGNAPDIAKEALAEKFLIDPSMDGAGTLLPDGKYNASLELQRWVSYYEKVHGAQGPGQLPEAFAKKIRVSEHSLLRGGILLGVIDDAGFKKARELALESFAKREAGETKTADELLDLTKSVERERALEARTVTQMWRKMSGMEKLVLIVGALFAMKSAPGVGLALGSVYFGQKLFMKQDKPLEGWGKVIASALGAIGAPFKKFGVGQEFKPSDIAERSNAVVPFLSEEAHEELGASATGFALLSHVSMHDLAHAFELDEAHLGMTGIFRAEEIIPLIERDAKARNWDPNSADFLRNPANAAAVADALATVFYLAGKNTYPGKHDIDIVEREAKKYPSYDDIPADLVLEGDTVRRRLFRIAMHGKNNALNGDLSEVTLGEYMHKALTAYTTMERPEERERIDIELDPEYLRLKNEIENHTYKNVPANLKVALDKAANTVTVDVGGTAYPLPFRVSAPEFMKNFANGIDVIKKWREEGLAQKALTMGTLNTSLAHPDPLTLELDGEIIRYHPALAAPSPFGRAETSAYVFLSAPIDAIHSNYELWFNKHCMGVPPGAPMPVDLDPF